MLLKDTSDSSCVYKMNEAGLACFLFAMVGITARRQELHSCRHHQSVTLLALYTDYLLFVHLL